MWSRYVLPLVSRFPIKGGYRRLSSTQQETSLPANRRKLLYRSKQTGFLELDLILGNWAEENLSKLSEGEIQEYEKLIHREVPDLYSWLSGQQEPPEELDGKIFRRIRDSVWKGTINKSKTTE
jgi:succinate dehydrogenase flavin-adding protein (antitoxin of CptAB toxin-antitoxin module)